MDYSTLIPYFMALAALTAAPGPVMAVLIARSLGRNCKGAIAFAAGLCAGDVVAVCAVVLGVGVWLDGRPEWLSLVRYLGVAYLLWLAVQMWNDRSDLSAAAVRRTGWLASAGAGMALCLGNPSTLLIYMLLLPGVAPAGIAGAGHMVPLLIATLAAVGGVFFGTILLTRLMGRIVASPRSTMALSRISAGAVAATSLWILAV